MRVYRNPSALAAVALALLFANMVCDLISAASAAYSIAAIGAHQRGDIAEWNQLEHVDTASSWTAILSLIALIFTSIAVLRWVHRINSNAHALNPEWMTISPGWNVGFFFIPVASLFKPFTGIRESWQVSANPQQPSQVDTPSLMRWWWGAWLVGNCLSQMCFRFSLRAESLDDLVVVAWMTLAEMIADIAASILLILLIRRMTAMQAIETDCRAAFA